MHGFGPQNLGFWFGVSDLGSFKRGQWMLPFGKCLIMLHLEFSKYPQVVTWKLRYGPLQ